MVKSGGRIQIHGESGGVFDSVTSEVSPEYFAPLETRKSGGSSFKSEVLDVVYNTVVFHPKGNLEYGKTYYVTVDEGMITDTSGNSFSVKESDGWKFTVRSGKPNSSGKLTLAADGSGEFCSVEGVLQALPDSAPEPRIVTVKSGVYPGILRMSHSNIHFKGAGIFESVIAPKNSTRLNSDREGIELTGSDVTFENLSIYNTVRVDGSGRQAEALYVKKTAKRVFLDNVQLISFQDTLRVDGQVYMEGGKITGSTDPLWGSGGAFYCDGCELMERNNGHAFVVARNMKVGLVNCKVTAESIKAAKGTTLAQVHGNKDPGTIAFVNCKIDDHIVSEGWRNAKPSYNWYEYNNTRLSTGEPVIYTGKQLSLGDPVLDSLSSPKKWLGWAP